MSDSLSLAFLILLETLSSVERAVFLLREIFDYDYREIAEIIQKSEANCRQIFARAKTRLGGGKPRFHASAEAQQELATRFFDAAGEGASQSHGLPRGRRRLLRRWRREGTGIPTADPWS
jgi:RNA polymerase sigma-70 factor (ECF subfamily)